MKTTISLIILSLLTITSFGQRKEFRKASVKNTVGAYQDFLEKFPKSKFSEKAIEMKINACNKWYNNLPRNDIKYMEMFLDICKGSEHIDDVKELLWNKTIRNNSKESFQQFIKNYPNSKHVQEAKNKIEMIDWKKALKLDTKEVYKNFKTDYPNSVNINKVDSLVQILNIFALPKAAEKGNETLVLELVQNASSEMKSRALMYAVWGALHTNFDSRYDVNGNIIDYSVRSAKAPREPYIKIIELLLENGGDPKRYAFAKFGSVEVSLFQQWRKNLNKGNSTVTYRLGSTSEMNLIPYGKGGLSIEEVAMIHKAEDILKLISL